MSLLIWLINTIQLVIQNTFKKEFNLENKSPNIPFIQYDETFMNVPPSLVAVWIDPLDATQEFIRISNSISY